mmetsp:Transcript_24913/g.41038  ORF Transcript_24913/g.41038 Transcript_24913/m.41038 type:complete len:345 (-) Transcript_24913:408-1442(-)|eukprot:CAMPEP_0184655424 /NCGR_PEP_ID=MMETSP0308-20130426/13033_1 /TAXON_ID=38269 /ORGANISM="Gloeochaete witrockiana, Strain SAG 46.84" /LENGTH=344 /DNA_ID=CAMNT_0027091877 /DNA_START=100 /DNA_END=1134 /DNA_ORIENTATION=-
MANELLFTVGIGRSVVSPVSISLRSQFCGRELRSSTDSVQDVDMTVQALRNGRGPPRDRRYSEPRDPRDQRFGYDGPPRRGGGGDPYEFSGPRYGPNEYSGNIPRYGPNGPMGPIGPMDGPGGMPRRRGTMSDNEPWDVEARRMSLSDNDNPPPPWEFDGPPPPAGERRRSRSNWDNADEIPGWEHRKGRTGSDNPEPRARGSEDFPPPWERGQGDRERGPGGRDRYGYGGPGGPGMDGGPMGGGPMGGGPMGGGPPPWEVMSRALGGRGGRGRPPHGMEGGPYYEDEYQRGGGGYGPGGPGGGGMGPGGMGPGGMGPGGGRRGRGPGRGGYGPREGRGPPPGY